MFSYFIYLQSSGSFLTNNWPLLVVFIIFLFITIYPQQKKQKEQKKFSEALKKGDRVVTNGGIVGTIINLESDFVTIQLEGKSAMKLLRSAINLDSTAAIKS